MMYMDLGTWLLEFNPLDGVESSVDVRALPRTILALAKHS